jgi:hypothetical protein
MVELGLAVGNLNDRVEKWRSEGIFEHQDAQAIFDIRLRKLNKILQWPSAREAHFTMQNLVQTWKDEDRWERMVFKEIEDNKAEAARSGGYA